MSAAGALGAAGVASTRSTLAGIGAGVDRRVLGGLWAADALFIALHIAYRLGGSEHVSWSLVEDRGLAESYQVLKTLALALALWWAARRRGEALLALWGALFAYLALDDVLGLHGAGGRWLAAHLAGMSGLGRVASDVGELIVLGSVVLAFSLAGLVAWRRGRLRWSERGTALAILTLPLVTFGVVVDFLHALVLEQRLRGLFLLEDGGELLAMSLVAAYALPLACGARLKAA